MKLTGFVVVAIAAGALMARSAEAGVITAGTVYNNTGGVFSGAYTVEKISNQSGLSAGYVSGVTDFATYVGSGVTHATLESAGGTWLSNGVGVFPKFLDFDLGLSQDVLSLALWNGTAGDDAAVNAFSVFTSQVADFSASAFVGAFNNPIGSPGPEPVSVYDLANTTARYVRVRIDSYYGNGCCVGIGEVAFDVQPSAVPEPGTMSLLGLGLSLLGARAARRKRS